MTAGPADPGCPALPWQVHRRPHPRMLLMAGACGLLLAVGSALLIHGLMAEPSAWLAGLVGAVLGGLVVQQVAQGAAVRVSAEGRLTYALRGKDNLVVDLGRARGVRFVATGALQGAGLEVDPEAVELLDRKGVSRAMMDAWQAALGTAVVLEFLTPADARELELLRRALDRSGGPA